MKDDRVGSVGMRVRMCLSSLLTPASAWRRSCTVLQYNSSRTGEAGRIFDVEAGDDVNLIVDAIAHKQRFSGLIR